MKLAIHTRTENPKVGDFCQILTSRGASYELNPTLIDDSYAALVTLGGDGTLLSGVRKIYGRDSINAHIPILGINSGRLGFLSTFGIDQSRSAVDMLLDGNYDVEHRTMLEVRDSNSEVQQVALNEFTLQRSGVAMVEIYIRIDGVDVASYWADGVIVSTPTGSTAYSMSVGGAILTPNSQCFIISPVASHNLSLRPLVIPDTSMVEITVRSENSATSIVTVDNCQLREAMHNQTFRLCKSQHRVKLITLGEPNFYDTLRKKLHWGVDLRSI